MSLELIALALAAGSTAASFSAQSKQRDAERAQQAIREAEATRANVRSLREARVAGARVRAAQAAMGGSSSTTEGAISSIGSTTGSNIGFRQGVMNVQQTALNRMQGAGRMASMGAALGQFANLAASFAGPVGSNPPAASTPSSNTTAGLSNAMSYNKNALTFSSGKI